MMHLGGRIILAWNPLEFQVSPYMCSSQMVQCKITPKNGKSLMGLSFMLITLSKIDHFCGWICAA